MNLKLRRALSEQRLSVLHRLREPEEERVPVPVAAQFVGRDLGIEPPANERLRVVLQLEEKTLFVDREFFLEDLPKSPGFGSPYVTITVK